VVALLSPGEGTTAVTAIAGVTVAGPGPFSGAVCMHPPERAKHGGQEKKEKMGIFHTITGLIEYPQEKCIETSSEKKERCRPLRSALP